jgi:hypothetical protein
MKDWAVTQPWICSLSFWSSNRDKPGNPKTDHGSGIAQEPWDFTKAFQTFASR